MDSASEPMPETPGAIGIARTGFVRHNTSDPGRDLLERLGNCNLELVVIFASYNADSSAVIESVAGSFAPTPVVGCTTAGEITHEGYTDGWIVAIGFPKSHFRAKILSVPDLGSFNAQDLIDLMIGNRNAMMEEVPNWHHEFTFLLIDGLSTREDVLVSELAPGLGPVPLFGGSAGDGTRFDSTYVLHDGHALENAAILIQIRTRCPVKVFKFDHLVPTSQRMVVTEADPARRIVREINAEPAAREYARILRKDPEQLTTFTFAAHPVAVKIGGEYHVRAIQQVTEDGDLVFFSAIDEGLVLTLAEPRDMIGHLNEEIKLLAKEGLPDIVLGCDCILRRLEAQERQMTGAISKILSNNRVVGFSTYGEQFNSIHVNQTLTGVAIYPPEDERQ
ncbi:MAG: FIST C-terminal domain-containing protein [Roseovarius sp.]|nr:FIST C-terminal domain-containing protein [Roseovarius sp.]